MAKKCLFNISRHFPHTFLDCGIVMPNHIHIIIGIKCRDAKFCISTKNTKFNIPTKNTNKFGPQSKNLSSIIRGFKIGVKKYTTINNIEFKWQSRFYDHIVYDKNDLNRIRNYIKNNPAKWWRDRNNS